MHLALWQRLPSATPPTGVCPLCPVRTLRGGWLGGFDKVNLKTDSFKKVHLTNQFFYKLCYQGICGKGVCFEVGYLGDEGR